MQVIKRRIDGKDGSDRIRELRAILADLPGYKNGPYADIRKWVTAEIERSRVRAKVVNRDSIAVRREGVAQVAFVGPPNAGKSSLLQALSNIQIKTGDYPFTTLRPGPRADADPGRARAAGRDPGLISGAAEDRGGGRALLGVLRGADAIVYCHEASARPSASRRDGGGRRRRNRAVPPSWRRRSSTRPTRPALARLGALGLEVVPVSVLDDASVERFACRALAAHWPDPRVPAQARRGRVGGGGAASAGHRRRCGAVIHHQLEEQCLGAHVWGPSRGSRVSGSAASTSSRTTT